jgi:hypothetical protein
VIGFVLVLALATYVLRILVPMGTWVPIVDFPTSNYLPQYVSFFALGMVAYRRGWFDSTTAAMGRFGLGLAVGAHPGISSCGADRRRVDRPRYPRLALLRPVGLDLCRRHRPSPC